MFAILFPWDFNDFLTINFIIFFHFADPKSVLKGNYRSFLDTLWNSGAPKNWSPRQMSTLPIGKDGSASTPTS